jgi:hypothetical protein
MLPNHNNGEDLPNLNQAKALRFPAGHGLLLHLGTWHDFPIACDRPCYRMQTLPTPHDTCTYLGKNQ